MNIGKKMEEWQETALEKILPAERLEKKKRLRDRKKADRYLLSSVLLQYGIGQVCGLPIRAVAYEYGEYGKPLLRRSESVPGDHFNLEKMKIDFNLSHSGEYAVLAISDAPIGIDIEQKHSGGLQIAKRCFCPEEYQDILAGETQQERDMRFLQYWTMKEAYVKRIGKGMRVPLSSFRVHREEAALSYVEDSSIYFFSQMMNFGTYRMSVCSEKKEDLNIFIDLCKINSNYMQKITIEDVFASG